LYAHMNNKTIKIKKKENKHKTIIGKMWNNLEHIHSSLIEFRGNNQRRIGLALENCFQSTW
jgi:hypothetical protein